MNIYDATEQAYKNGYAAGFEAGRESVTIELASVYIDTENKAANVCFKLRDIYLHMSIPLNWEEIRTRLAEADKKE